MSQIEEIRAFVMVVETGSLTQAAERLGIAVSAVSRRLKDLELRLGAPLIQRTTRRMYLNEVGQGFYERCKAVLDELEAAQQRGAEFWRKSWRCVADQHAAFFWCFAYVIRNRAVHACASGCADRYGSV